MLARQLGIILSSGRKKINFYQKSLKTGQYSANLSSKEVIFSSFNFKLWTSLLFRTWDSFNLLRMKEEYSWKSLAAAQSYLR